MYDTLQRKHADDVVERRLVHGNARVIRRRQLLAEQRRLVSEIERVDLAPWGHDVVDGDRFEVEQVGEHRPMLAANVVAAFEHERAQFLLGERRACVRCRLDPQQLQQSLDEEIDEPHGRRRRLQHRNQRKAHQRREPVGMRRADDFRRDLGEHEQRERDRDRTEPQSELALTE